MLRFTELIAHLIAVDLVQLPPFNGSSFRGAFMSSLKSATCIGGGSNCTDSCAWPDKCPYGQLAETPVPENAPSQIAGSKYAPHPFILTPPPEGGLVFPGDTLALNVRLFGSNGMRHIPSVAEALDRLGAKGIGKDRGKLRLQRIETRNGELLWKAGDVDMKLGSLDLESIELKTDTPVQSNDVAALTPLQLRRNKRLIDHPDFLDFVYASATRLEIMQGLYGTSDPEQLSPRQWTELASRTEITGTSRNVRRLGFERYSKRQDSKHPIEGVLGNWRFEGDLTPFAPLFTAATKTNLGKGTSFGLGQIDVEFNRQ